jgi:hypothetical protein
MTATKDDALGKQPPILRCKNSSACSGCAVATFSFAEIHDQPPWSASRRRTMEFGARDS